MKWFQVESHIRALSGQFGDFNGPMQAPSEVVLREGAEKNGIDIVSVREMTEDEVRELDRKIRTK